MPHLEQTDPKRGLSNDEIARRGKALYEPIRPRLEATERGKRLAIDVFSGEYEVDDNSIAAARRLRSRVPDAVVFGLRIGFPPARIGPRLRVRRA